MFSLLLSVAVVVVAAEQSCEGCDAESLLQKSLAGKLDSDQVPEGGSTCPNEEPWPCANEALKFGPLQAINDETGPPCQDTFANISVLDITTGEYTPVCRVTGVCLNACSINPTDNFLYCQATNNRANESTGIPRVNNNFVRISCPGLTSFAVGTEPVDATLCYVGGRYGNTNAASFDLDGNYIWEESGGNILKITSDDIHFNFTASTSPINNQDAFNAKEQPIVTRSDLNGLADFTVVPEDIFGNCSTCQYLVGCLRRTVVIQNLDVPADPTVTLDINMIDGNSTPGSGSGAQWYWNSTGQPLKQVYCAYNQGNGVISMLLSEVNLVDNTINAGRVSDSADTGSNDGMNCLTATPPPFNPPASTTTTTTFAVTCEHGIVNFTFDDSPTGALDVNTNLSDNIRITGVVQGNNNNDCLGAGVLTTANAGTSATDLISGAPLLVYTSESDWDDNQKVSACTHGGNSRRPRIILGFYEPVDILGVEFWNQFARGGQRSGVAWEVSGGGFDPLAVALTPNVNNLPTNESLYVDISTAGPIYPINVTQLAIVYGNLPGVKTIRFCKKGGGGMGDPHIHTLDGQHYTLLRQGTFLLWRFTDQTQIGEASTEASPSVDWQVYAHYSGHASYTKGLLLLDTSNPLETHALELTSHDCKWRSRKGQGQWTLMEKPELLMVQVGSESVTGMNVKWNTKEDYQQVKLNMNSKHGMKGIATLHIACRPNHNINTAIVMERPGDGHLVRGQIGVTSKRHLAIQKRSGVSTLQTAQDQGTSQDQEFMSDKQWTELGGSTVGATYLNSVDEQGFSLVQHTCSGSREADAMQICTKHLGVPQGHEVESFADCVYDVCTGGGEVAAELMAVIATKSKE